MKEKRAKDTDRERNISSISGIRGGITTDPTEI